MIKRVLITGGFGYLGGRIAVELAKEPNWVVRLGSRRLQQSPSWLPDSETVVMDVLDPKTLAAAIAGVQAVVHLAAMNENECVADPGKAVLVNTIGTLNVLQTAIDSGVERFIYFSTAHVYGAPLMGHITECTLPRPAHPYATTHRAAEDYVLSAYDQKKIASIVVRLSNGFGAPTHAGVNRWTLLVNDLCRQSVENRKMVLRSNGLQKRDFITLGDVGRAVKHVLHLPRGSSLDGLFNLGGEISLTVWEMVKRISDRCEVVLNFRPDIIRPEPSVGEKEFDLTYDTYKLQQTGFQLQGDIDSEIDGTLRLCREFVRMAT